MNYPDPVDYNERYDRQIRLWGQHAQNKLKHSKVCLINATPVGTEILKGLCLGGLGSFTILDSSKVSEDDIESNFFLTKEMASENRGQCIKQSMIDMAEDIIGFSLPTELYLSHWPSSENLTHDQVERNIEFWKQFNAIILNGNLYIDQILNLSKICWNLNIPLILVKSLGFYGHFYTQFREHHVEAHEENNNNLKNNQTTTLMQTSSLNSQWDCKVTLRNNVDDDEYQDIFSIHLALRAVDIFYSTYSRVPGYQDDQVETDFLKLKDCTKTAVGNGVSSIKMLDQHLYELCRSGGAELHTTSAFTGGCVAQEVIKLVTNQYMPVDNVFVYNSVTAQTTCFKYSDVCDILSK